MTARHEWCRVQWRSPRAQAAWGPVADDAVRRWPAVERMAVVMGLRSLAYQVVTPKELRTFVHETTKLGLTFRVVSMERHSSVYTSQIEPVRAGEPFRYRVVVGRAADVMRYSPTMSSEELGLLLGYPACCREAFARRWDESHGIDPTWDMMAAIEQDGTKHVRFEHPETNLLLRALGVRLVPHLPCSHLCEASIQLGRRYAVVFREQGWAQHVQQAQDMLRWEMTWSAQNGCAILTTPRVRISSTTDAGPVRRLVVDGTTPPPDPVVKSIVVPSSLTDIAKDNGFASVHGMQQSHRPIQSLAARASTEHVRRIVDLGCGDGTLLASLGQLLGQPTLGFDTDRQRVARGRMRNPSVRFSVSSFTSYEPEDGDLVVFMPGRLTELAPDQASAFVEKLKRPAALMLYEYGDWIVRYPLVAFADRMGLTTGRTLQASDTGPKNTCVAALYTRE